MPFRATVLVDWLLYQDTGLGPMSGTLFRNIAGRSGRAGIYTEGDTIAFDNPIGDPASVQRRHRIISQREIFFGEGTNRKNLKSSIAQASIEDASSDLAAGLESQFVAAIQENPKLQDLEEAFAAHTFAARALQPLNGATELVTEKFGSVRNLLDHRFRAITNSLLATDPAGGAMAVRQSPLRLTELGKAVNISAFSPRSCRKIIQWLSGLTAPLPEGADLIAELLRIFGDLPEQQVEKFKAALNASSLKARNYYCVQPEHLELVIRDWLAALPVERIFVRLPNVLKSSRKPGLDVWISGEVRAPNWDLEFDKFTDFIGSVIRGFTPWLLRACETLSEHVGGESSEVDWVALAERVEKPASYSD